MFFVIAKAIQMKTLCLYTNVNSDYVIVKLNLTFLVLLILYFNDANIVYDI